MDRFCGFEVVAHRGAMGYAPENTLVSFQKALDMSATMIELDVHLTKDREIVVVHDCDLVRTTNGRGLVEDMTLAEIKALDAGIAMGPEFKGEKVPTLQEAMELIDHRAAVNIELKTGRTLYPDIVDKVLEVIYAYDAEKEVVISSFHKAYLREVRRKARDIELAVLFERPEPDIFAEAVREGWQGLHPWYRLVDENFMGEARRWGLAVRPWTVNRESEMLELLRAGVTGIITNFPDLLNSVVTQFSAESPSSGPSPN
ncbi:MAG TPA: glycerophosphodiester phosphodiesterase [Firmicutes bacterium]|nr:glycerophosphodiester phosphodiesterase [Bacillota bacterium]